MQGNTGFDARKTCTGLAEWFTHAGVRHRRMAEALGCRFGLA
jgi:hypothetical protein